MFLLTTGELPLSRSQKHALLAFVHDRGGLVGFHSATDTFHYWPAYIKLIGAEFSHHPRKGVHPYLLRTVANGGQLVYYTVS